MKTFKCNDCQKEFSLPTPYLKHLMIFHDTNPSEIEYLSKLKEGISKDNSLLRCRYCGKVYNIKACLEKHEQIHGSDGKLIFKCSCCPKYFSSLKDSFEHAKTNHSDLLTCNICNKLFSSLESIATHNRRKHKRINDIEIGNDKTEKYENKKCDNNFVNESEHQPEVTLPKEEIFECTQCPKQFLLRRPYVKHLVIEHGTNLYEIECSLDTKVKKTKQNTLRCRYCAKVYSMKSCLIKHEEVHGPDGNLIFKCSCCSKYFASTKECIEHAKTNHVDKLTCDICKKIFSTLDSLAMHKKNLHQLKPIINNSNEKLKNICRYCGSIFMTKTALNNHERSNCGQNPLYECSVCKKRFQSAGSLSSHLIIHSGKMEFECTHCGKCFRTKSQLHVHERKHTGDKPFKCEVCDKAFPYRESLLTHATLHTGVKRYVCNGCGSRFSCISNLQNHRKVRQESCGKLPLYSKAVAEPGVRDDLLKIKKNIKLKQLNQV